jgi:predicted RNA binding protein YcfA (HicA-like mRNA interferase family)
MAIHHIENLRREFPNHFEDRDESIFPDDYIVIPTDEPNPPRGRSRVEDIDEEEVDDEELSAGVAVPDPAESLEDWLAEYDVDVPLEPLSEKELEAFGGHPGGLINDPPGGQAGATTVIDRLAFYLPFHSYRNWWGIYILPEGILTVRRELMPFFKAHGIGNKDQVRIAKRLLYHHEYYHHAVESFGTRLEAITSVPMYVSAFTPRYCTTQLTPACYEETCANSYARERVLSTLQGISAPRQGLRDAINLWFEGQPPGYREASMTTSAWKYESRIKLYEDYLNLWPCAAFYRPPMPHSASQVAWAAAGYFDRGIGDIRSRISYLVKKGSHLHSRLPVDARTCLKLRSFKQKLQNCGIGRFVREGGNHELWAPCNGEGRIVPIPRHDGRDLPTGTMRAILKQLGSNMSIEEFLTFQPRSNQ